LEPRPVKSKLIEAIAYDETDRRLTVFFVDGHVSQFDGVPKGVVVGLELAASPGDYYMSEIRTVYPRS